MSAMNISFELENNQLFPIINGCSHENFFSLEKESSFHPNQCDDNLSGRFIENETSHNILFSSENENSVESNQRRGIFNKGEISNLNDNSLFPLFENKNN